MPSSRFARNPSHTPHLTAVLQLYSFPDGAYKGLATRFVLPARAVAFSGSGTTLASAGDDEGIKLISTDDRKVG